MESVMGCSGNVSVAENSLMTKVLKILRGLNFHTYISKSNVKDRGNEKECPNAYGTVGWWRTDSKRRLLRCRNIMRLRTRRFSEGVWLKCFRSRQDMI